MKVLLIISAIFNLILLIRVLRTKTNPQLEKKYEQHFNEKFNLKIALMDSQYQSRYNNWKTEYERKIRKDAVTRSKSSVIGKVSEHLLPFFESFPYNPRDVKFIGSPFDLLVICGMDDNNVTEIVFVEVKTGKFASLTGRERQIRDCIKNGKVRWEEIKIERNDTPDSV